MTAEASRKPARSRSPAAFIASAIHRSFGTPRRGRKPTLKSAFSVDSGPGPTDDRALLMPCASPVKRSVSSAAAPQTTTRLGIRRVSKSVSFQDFIRPSAIRQAFLSPKRHKGGGSTSALSGEGSSSPPHTLRQSLSDYVVGVQEEKAMQSAPSVPIDATQFVAYVTERRKKSILFKGEYLMVLKSIDPVKCTTEVGTALAEKNAYPSLPYDHNRVVLETKPDDPDSHYINASFVQSWTREKAYVVTQSVKSKQQTAEFWRMVWELGSNTIVMLTKIFDFMRVMCLQYWPQTRFQFGDYDVETLETKTYAHFIIRTFRMKRVDDPDGASARTIKHFHFTEWELNSFPYISAFIELRRRVRQWTTQAPVDGPIIVHCSNGGGRSGAFLALDANLELKQRNGVVDVYEYCKTMVNSRKDLIDSVSQYRFIYDVLYEAILCDVEPLAMYQLRDRSSMYRSRKDRELMELQDAHEKKLLFMLTLPLRVGDCAGGHRLENRGKNRDVMVVPPDHARPYLQTLHGESKDYTYINAVEVDGFNRKSEFIVTEWPKSSTVDSFWTLIFDHSVHTVINLTNSPKTNQYPPFIHNKGKRNYGPFSVEVLNYQQYPGMTSHMVKIMKR
ncbi:Protein T13H5.1 b, partial [Aphelenchoides avenae]